MEDKITAKILEAEMHPDGKIEVITFGSPDNIIFATSTILYEVYKRMRNYYDDAGEVIFLKMAESAINSSKESIEDARTLKEFFEDFSNIGELLRNTIIKVLEAVTNDEKDKEEKEKDES